MDFDKSRVYTALNADELKPGSKVILSNNLDFLKSKVSTECDVTELKRVFDESYERRFQTDFRGTKKAWLLAYLISEPEEKNWIVYLHRKPSLTEYSYYLTSCRSDRWESVKEDYGAKTKLFEGTEDECERWYTSRRHLTNVIAAWEDGKDIQFKYDDCWVEASNPEWNINTMYRIKPEGLKWTDLKLGDVIKCKTETRMVTGIDTTDEPDEDGDVCHICAGGWWSTDKELEEWEKVE